MLRTKTLIALALAANVYGMTATAGEINTKYYGAPAAAVAANRVIEITSGVKSVQVNNGEIVTFSVDGQRYTWSFQLYSKEGAIALSALLPNNIRADGVTVYVAADPLYR
jgi:hypothetical protein